MIQDSKASDCRSGFGNLFGGLISIRSNFIFEMAALCMQRAVNMDVEPFDEIKPIPAGKLDTMTTHQFDFSVSDSFPDVARHDVFERNIGEGKFFPCFAELVGKGAFKSGFAAGITGLAFLPATTIL